jgi:hypothetical protein
VRLDRDVRVVLLEVRHLLREGLLRLGLGAGEQTHDVERDLGVRVELRRIRAAALVVVRGARAERERSHDG